MNNNYNIQECDVLVIGGGMAGLSAAIRAKSFADKVILVEKARVTRSGSSIYAHAYGGPPPEGGFESRMKENVQRSAYLGDQSWFEIMQKEIGERLNEFERWGVVFERDEQGNRKGDSIRGQSQGFVVLAHGKQVIETLAKEAIRRGVKFIERVAIFDLLTSDGSHPTGGYVVGAVGVHTRTAEFIVFKAKAMVIATGLISGKLHRFSMDNMTGDGYAMAFRAGADITGLEFGPQPFIVWARRFCTGGVGQFQHGGSKLVNRLGEEFLYKYPGASKTYIGFEGHFDQGAICRAIAVENLEGRGPCYLDCRGWSQDKFDKMHNVLPLTMRAFDEPGVGVDLKKEPVEVTPMVGHYGLSCQSGIRINTLGETVVRGLHAAGSAAHYGGGPSPQALSAVGGYRAGENAAKWARDVVSTELNLDQIARLKESYFVASQREKGLNPDQIYYSVNAQVTPWGASLFKHERRIKKILAEIKRIEQDDLPRVKADNVHELIKAIEAKNFVLMMQLYNSAALERKESRIVHFREDYPFIDDLLWRKWVLLESDDKGGIQVKIEPVPQGCSAITPDKLTRRPAPVTFDYEGYLGEEGGR